MYYTLHYFTAFIQIIIRNNIYNNIFYIKHIIIY